MKVLNNCATRGDLKMLRSDKEQYLFAEDDDADFCTSLSAVGKSPSTSPRNSLSSIGSTSSSQFGKEYSKKDHGGTPTSRAALAKLARLLTQKDKSAISDRSPTCNSLSSPDAGSIGSLRKASSIDSLLDSSSAHGIDISVSSCGGASTGSPPGVSLPVSSAVLTTPGTLNVPSAAANGAAGTPIPLSPSVPAKLESQKRGTIPTSPSVPSKLAKNASGRRQGSMDLLLEGVSLTKAERKKLEKLNKFNFDLQALFAAVEHEHLERARSILETTDVDINSFNADGFTPLDIAVMTMNIPMVKLLQSFGGRERSNSTSKETRSSHLSTLVKEAEKCMEDLTTCVLSAATNGNLSTALLKEKERQLTLWERRHRLLKRMKTGFEQMRCPDPPNSVQLEVVGTRSLKVKFVEPETANEMASIVTKYRVEWSCYEDFSPLAGSQEITELHKLEVTIPDLTQGVSYFVRVAAGNAKGFSEYQATSPLSAVPSSWRDLDERVPRSCGKLRALDDIFHQIINSRPEHAAEIKVAISDTCDTPQQQRRLMRKSIKNLFTPAPRFHKCMKRGVFLSCLLYNEDKVLVTTEETLPIIEVDESFPSSLHTDFHWMLKVACTWEDVKSLRMEMEKSHSSSSVHFRSKLLQAVEQMQAALGLQDLGQLFYKPLKDTEGTIVLCTVKYVSDPKSLNSLSVRWLPLAKIQRKLQSATQTDSSGAAPAAGGATTDASSTTITTTVGELLMSTLQEMITYNQLSSIPLSRGLYLGYVKLKSSVDLIRVLVPRKMPNVLPHCRVRENPHVSREEWEWIKNMMPEGGEAARQQTAPTEVQRKFQKALASASKNMLAHLEIPQEQFDGHRLYDAEVIELSSDVSLILVLPPIDSVCSVPGQSDDLTSRTDFILLPVQIFEMTHMRTYQNNFIARYSRISSILEMDTMVAQHAHREAFSSSEIAASKERLAQLQDFQTQVDNIWRGMRWIMDVVTFARDKQASSSGIPLSCVCMQISEMPSPTETTPHQSPTTGSTQQPPTCTGPLGAAREEYEKKILLRITASSSSYSLVDTIPLPAAPEVTLDIRRCVSTSRLLGSQNNGLDTTTASSDHSVASTLSFNPEAASCEHLNISFDNDESVGGISITCGPAEDTSAATPLQTPAASSMEFVAADGESDDLGGSGSKRNSLGRSSCTGSIKSDVDAADLEAESISVYSKDSACSSADCEGGGGGSSGHAPLTRQRTPSTEDDADADFFYRPSSANSTGSSTTSSAPSECLPGILRVYAAYDTGLPSGTSVKLHVTPQTRAREVVDLVVKQLNMAVILKGKGGPIYGSTQLRNFCLVAVVGTREKCLSDSFQPLKLQNPWTNGKLYVKIKNGAAAAADSTAAEVDESGTATAITSSGADEESPPPAATV